MIFQFCRWDTALNQRVKTEREKWLHQHIFHQFKSILITTKTSNLVVDQGANQVIMNVPKMTYMEKQDHPNHSKPKAGLTQSEALCRRTMCVCIIKIHVE